MLAIMLAGTLAKPVEIKVARNGSPYAVATVKTDSAEPVFASISAFGELADQLGLLVKGDPLTVIGSGRLTAYQTKDGDYRAGLSITASRLITLQDQQQKAKAKGKPQEPVLEPAFNDEIPF